MVRFIIYGRERKANKRTKFTFQYGQIYYLRELTIYTETVKNLHSNMVRFIIAYGVRGLSQLSAFTFQYGQIYYAKIYKSKELGYRIYIPIWLDLLSSKLINIKYIQEIFTFQYGQIYYLQQQQIYKLHKFHLHSNMVRFIIRQKGTSPSVPLTFTFQYGQIYYI